MLSRRLPRCLPAPVAVAGSCSLGEIEGEQMSAATRTRAAAARSLWVAAGVRLAQAALSGDVAAFEVHLARAEMLMAQARAHLSRAHLALIPGGRA